MDAIRRITGLVIAAAVVAAVATACGDSTVPLDSKVTVATVRYDAQPSETTRVAAYCAVERESAATLGRFHSATNPSGWTHIVGKASSAATIVAELGPAPILDDLRTQRTVLADLKNAFANGEFDAGTMSARTVRFVKRSPAFLAAAARIEAYDRSACGIDAG